MKNSSCAAIAVLVTLSLLGAGARADTELKIATLAPKGSTWMRYIYRLQNKVEEATAKKVRLKLYPGGVHGDEPDLVRKMRTGQIDGASITASGLAMVNPEALVLQMPLLLATEAQIDRVLGGLDAQLSASFEKRGYVLVGWSEMGWEHLYTTRPARTLAELRRLRVWAWSADPVWKSFLRHLRIPFRTLSVPEIYPSLATGMIETVNASPLTLLAFQWQTKLRWHIDFPIWNGLVATVLSKKSFDRLTPEEQKQVRELGRRYHRASVKRVRRDHQAAIQALAAGGIQRVTFDSATTAAMRAAAEKVTAELTGRYFSRELLEQVRRLRNAN